MALQMLYQRELGEASSDEVIQFFPPRRAQGSDDTPTDADSAKRRRHQGAFVYARTLFEGVMEHREEIDRLIGEQAENWRLERMPAVDRNVLRLAVYEMVWQTDVPKLVVLDEAIELAKTFGSENSSRFVNGLLDGLLRTQAFPGSLT